jgi:sulfite dehydrogenase
MPDRPAPDRVPDRRTFLRAGALAGASMLLPRRSARAADAPKPVAPEMARFPEKTDLILLTDRPPQLETPLKYFREDYTPNDAFFVRWHLGIVPTSTRPSACRSTTSAGTTSR